MLKCPNCQKDLSKIGNTYKCDNGHSFDVARQGYTNLLIHHRKNTGDDQKMVNARTNFFDADFYHILKSKMVELIANYKPKMIVDSGCGEGYYTNAIAISDNNYHIYGFDVSKYALRKASSKHLDNVEYFAGNIFDLPIKDNSIDLLYSIFAPISFKENARVLKDGGIFIKVGPGPKHLYDLKDIIYEKAYLNPIKDYDQEEFIKVDDLIIEDTIHLKNEDIKNVLMMTPYIHNSPKSGLEKLFSYDEIETIIEFHIEVFKKK